MAERWPTSRDVRCRRRFVQSQATGGPWLMCGEATRDATAAVTGAVMNDRHHDISEGIALAACNHPTSDELTSALCLNSIFSKTLPTLFYTIVRLTTLCIEIWKISVRVWFFVQSTSNVKALCDTGTVLVIFLWLFCTIKYCIDIYIIETTVAMRNAK